MIAEALPEALRNSQQVRRATECPREESFPQMYQVLGSAELQEQIRQAQPDRTHCSILRQHPGACDSLPAAPEFPELVGQVCPHNPYRKPELARIYEQAGEMEELLEQAMYVRDLVMLRAAGDQLPAEIFFAARIMAEWQRVEDLKLQHQMMAAMFGVKKKKHGRS